VAPRRSQNAIADRLLRDNAASDPVTGVTSGIGLHVVGPGVNQQRRATVGEERVGFATHAQHNVRIFDRCLCGAIGRHGEVGHVPIVMALGIEEAVLFLVRIEMRTSGLEVWRIALSVLMEVQRVNPRWQVLYVELDFHTLAGWLDGGGSDAVALRIFQRHDLLLDRLGGAGVLGNDGEATDYYNGKENERTCDGAIHNRRVVSQIGGRRRGRAI
jgi:hypothetical protein